MPYGDYTKENKFGELTDCESNTEGTKSSSRPIEFCNTVNCLGPVTCQSSMTVVPPSITVGGVTFAPQQVSLCVGISGGAPEGGVGTRLGEDGGGEGGATPPVPAPTAIMQTFTLLVAVG